MDSRRARRFLIVAFALSLLIHLILSGVIRWPFAAPQEEVSVVHIEHLRMLRIAHAPTPSPRKAAPPVHRARVHVAKAKALNPASTGGEGKAVYATAAPATPTPVPTPNCASLDTPVAVVSSPAPPVIPPQARAGRVSGTTRIQVTVDPTGNVENATVLTSSGSPQLDLVALDMARGAQYTPATHACKAIAGTYSYAVKFVAY